MEDEQKPKNIEVETYADDMAKIIGDNQDGVVQKIIHEEEQKEEEERKESPERKANKAFLILGVFLVVLTFVLVGVVYALRQKILTVEVPPVYVPIIFTDKTVFNEVGGLTKEQIAQTVANEVRASDVKEGGVEGIYLTENKVVVGLRKFLKLSEAGLDSTKLEFVNDNFLLGAVNSSGTKSPFILIQMRSASDVFDAVRAWEPKMFTDLHGYFGLSFSAGTKYLLEKDFEDGIIQNKNARILRDAVGGIVLMYVYAEDGSLVFTNSEVATGEIILRLAASHVKK